MTSPPSTPIQLDRLSVVFKTGGLLNRGHTAALQDITLTMAPGQTLGLVGESGSGKTTLGKVLVGLVRPTSGAVVVGNGTTRQQPGFQQLVGQNPRWALNPRLRIWRSVAEPLAIAHTPRADRRSTSERMLQSVGLTAEFADRYPHQLSGGQLQRAAIARALVSKPALIVFDEAVSALDVSVQVQTINIIKDVQAELGFAALFISHDLASVRYAASKVAVLYHGMLMHTAPSNAFYERPCHPYSLALQSANVSGHAVSLREDLDDGPDPASADPPGCPLASRCPFVLPRCRVERPALRDVAGQLTACHRADELAKTADLTSLLTRDTPAAAG